MSRLSRWAAVVVAVTLTVFGAPAAVADPQPWSVVNSPTDGMRAEVGETVLITGFSYLGEGTPADRAELTFDDGATWIELDDGGQWRYPLTPTEPGDITFRVRAWYQGMVGGTTAPRTLHVGTSGSLPPVECRFGCTFHVLQSPQDDTDTQAVELGVRFAVDRPGRLSEVRFERGAYRGPVTVRIWGPDGTLLHEQVEPVPNGGITLATINPPLPVQPGVDYVASYYTPAGGYRSQENYFTGSLLEAPFIVHADAGVYHYGDGGGFPTDSWNHSTYTVQPFFVF
ncbi:DUF4082 domain-containing protein [Actinocrispum wychmicini]|uniref:Molybdenum-dependent oxidoreductase-like protein n=1 Tax=Actinocrispum wychmicini TaxID=1213861 RepID=A0A4R2IYN3_9PSEU|nr:DUF4082 domain-containing protein [Actinocrispum wychmicini]TCO50634.1 molybdenum-dependent oxidoreductase-like protein [Actinocrispum wychmicini]